MTTATVSTKGWIVIPAKYRKKHHLKPGSKVAVVDYGRILAVIPLYEDPVREARGVVKGPQSLSRALLNDRRRQREREATR